jgi:hypothetical protein
MKRLSPPMLDVLMDCHEREMQQQEPCTGTSRTQSKKLLLSKGLLEARMYTSKANGKIYMAFFITQTGKEYLKNLST